MFGGTRRRRRRRRRFYRDYVESGLVGADLELKEALAKHSMRIGDQQFWLSIEGAAFAGCVSLTEVAIPESVTEIGDSAFATCASLSSVQMAGDAPSLGADAFAGVHSSAVVFLQSGALGYGDTFGGLPVLVVGEVAKGALFYNDSSFDETTDSDAIASSKTPLLPGQQATFANYSIEQRGYRPL